MRLAADRIFSRVFSVMPGRPRSAREIVVADMFRALARSFTVGPLPEETFRLLRKTLTSPPTIGTLLFRANVTPTSPCYPAFNHLTPRHDQAERSETEAQRGQGCLRPDRQFFLDLV